MKTIQELEELDRKITLNQETPRQPTWPVNLFMGFLMLVGIALFFLFTYGVIYIIFEAGKAITKLG
jgi:hypothetical protein